MTWEPGIWEPVVGVTFRPQLTSKLRIYTRADVGWGGDGSSRSGAATASIEWSRFHALRRPCEVAYGLLQVERRDAANAQVGKRQEDHVTGPSHCPRSASLTESTEWL